MNSKLIVLIGVTLTVLLLTGCVDTSGYNECFESYDNLILKGGWKIIGHSSDFVCCAEGRYFVTFEIQCYANCTIPHQTKQVSGFVYDSISDELNYLPDGLTPELPNEVIDWR
jgi:hypothetical protein